MFAPTDLPPPVPQPAPRTILFQRKRANRRILNEHMFLNVLREFGEVERPSEPSLIDKVPFEISKPAVPLLLASDKADGCSKQKQLRRCECYFTVARMLAGAGGGVQREHLLPGAAGGGVRHRRLRQRAHQQPGESRSPHPRLRATVLVLPAKLLGRLRLFKWQGACWLSPPDWCCLCRPTRRSCGRAQRRWSSSSGTGCGTAWTRASRWLLAVLWAPAHCRCPTCRKKTATI